MTDQAVREGGREATTAAGALVGRETELAALRDDIERAGLSTLSGRPAPHSRVLLIAGGPGSGRTALAGELARQVAGDYPDGVLRARLTGPGGAPAATEDVVRGLLTAAGAPAVPPGAAEDDLTAAFRRELTRRRAVLLLDDVGDSQQMLDLLPDGRRSLVVAVASGPLTGVCDVRPCVVGGLDRVAAVDLLRRTSGTRPRITVDPRRAESLAEACGNLPAALCMVGGWLAARPKLSVSDATAQLEQVPHAPWDRARAPDLLARAFRLVYGSLPGPVARTLRLLAVAPTEFVDAQTASALAGCPLDAAETALEECAALGLLHRHPAAPRCWTVPGFLDPLLRAELDIRERPGETTVARARLLERTVRQLQACHAATEPAGSSARTHLSGLPRSMRFAGAAEARGWLALRRPALLAGARAAVAEGDGELDAPARRLVRALLRAFDSHREPPEAAADAYRLHEVALQVARRRGPAREEAAALLELAGVDAGAGRLTLAVARYRAALDAARAARDTAAAGHALESLGGAYEGLGDWERAADWYGRALALRQTEGRLPAAARLHARTGAVHARSGRWDEALREWRAAASAYRRLRDPQRTARALGEAARAQERAGDPQASVRTCRDAVQAARQAGDVSLEAELRLQLAEVCEQAGDLAAARRHRSTGELLLGPTGRYGSATAGGSAVTTGATCESSGQLSED